MMPKPTNLSEQMARQLPVELTDFIRIAGQAAQDHGLNLYLVGGVVRDLLLNKTNLDLDLTVEGDAIALAKEIATRFQARVTPHQRFNTAKIKWDKWTVDMATARKETYAKPGALPTVKPSALRDDLIRRDFTINAMAVNLNPKHYGELIDLHGGQQDLQTGLVRILHEQSFVDDATRILRGLRYEQRLDFRFEEKTLALLRRDIPMLETISADRIRHEIELFLREPFPENIFRRADELGVLPKIHPEIKADDWVMRKFAEVRKFTAPNSPPPALYLALLIYRMTAAQVGDFITRLHVPKATAGILEDTVAIKTQESAIDNYKTSRSVIYHLLTGYTPMAISANAIATSHLIARRHLLLFIDELRYIKPLLSGDDILKMGIPQGPQVKEQLTRLLDARLNGEVNSKEDEMEFVESNRSR